MSTRLAITGHRFLSPGATAYVTSRLEEVMAGIQRDPARAPVCLASSLAEGADQIAARIAVGLHIRLEVVLPAQGYRASLAEEYRGAFDELVAAADSVRTLAYDRPVGQAYLEAGLAVLEGADLLLAVWDSGGARGTGGTADIVAAARERGTPVQVVWPDGYTRAGA